VPEPDSLQPLSAGLDRVVRSLRGASAQATFTLYGRWQAVVGDGIAAHAKPIKIEHGRLLVHVDEPGWATQLRFLEGDLLERLNGAGVELTGIDVRVAR
jgi:predicted nucleic acid-binding Zn ribbon protein